MLTFDGLPEWRAFSRGYWLRWRTPAPAGVPTHAFCGEHEIPGARCPQRDHPLLRLVSLDLSDLRLGMSSLEVSQLHLLYCWRCDLGDLSYRLVGDGVEIVTEKADRELGELEDDDFPYADYPMAFPRRDAWLDAVADDELELQIALRCGAKPPDEAPPALGMPHHQVGGVPLLVQAIEKVPDCEVCGAPTVFVAAISDDCAVPEGFTENDHVQVVFVICPPCRLMRAFNMAG